MNKSFAKLVDNKLLYAPNNVLKFNKNSKYKYIINPIEKDYIEAGYKKVEIIETTEIDENVECELVYKVIEDKIIGRYIKKEGKNGF